MFRRWLKSPLWFIMSAISPSFLDGDFGTGHRTGVGYLGGYSSLSSA